MKKNKVALIFLLIIFGSIPLTVFAALTYRTIFPRAKDIASPVSPPFPCKAGVNTFQVTETCSDGKARRVYYRCFDGSDGYLYSINCRKAAVFANVAGNACNKLSDPVCEVPNPTYYLIPSPTSIVMPISSPTSGYGIMALLMIKNGGVVLDQKDFSYNWTIDNSKIASIEPFTGCTHGILSPCPFDHADIKGLTRGSTKIRVRVIKNSTQSTVANAEFDLKVTK